MNKGSIRITGEIPDLPGREMGPVILRGGLFDGEKKRAPVKEVSLTISRSFSKQNEIVSGVYTDCGDRIFEAGETIRIFELRQTSTYTQREPKD